MGVGSSLTRTVNSTTATGLEVRIYLFMRFELLILRYLKGKRHGRGEYHYGDGSKYIGNWDNDKINGEGTSWYPNGNKYVLHNIQH